MKKILLITVITILSIQMRGQQLPLYSQYMLDQFLLNPAVAGSEGFTSFNLTAREQWLGFENAPRTHAISAQTRLLRTSHISRSRSVRKKSRRKKPSGRVGLGGYLFHDKNGIVSRTGMQLTYAYHIYVQNYQLSFGLSGTAYQFKIDKDGMVVTDPNDPLIEGVKNSLFVPDANVGVYLSNYNFYVGLSAAQLFQSSLKLNKDDGYKNYQIKRHYYFSTGYRFDFQNNYEVEPSILLKTDEAFKIQPDINVKGYYKRDYWMGLSYRPSSAVIIMAGIKVNKLYFGYAFDYSLSDIQKISYGSHEFMVGMKMGDSQRRYRWLNRF